jgi:hypothetical protein
MRLFVATGLSVLGVSANSTGFCWALDCIAQKDKAKNTTGNFFISWVGKIDWPKIALKRLDGQIKILIGIL